MSKKYGNSDFWCFLEEEWTVDRPIEIWHDIGGDESEVMASATDKFNAMQIVDSLCFYSKNKNNPNNLLTKHEQLFLHFVKQNCPEPLATTAENALLWHDREAYKYVKAKFAEFY